MNERRSWRIEEWADIEELVGYLAEEGAEHGRAITLTEANDGALLVHVDDSAGSLTITAEGRVKEL